ncbi:unnamed protein product [Caenorhabditis auriculariae]|uniref:Uncharacterized protein n=1 Tax=Caenorhabditis auriculariae TaxID=2777116 RepID=A0A8S1HTH6_9PELO|nr:unnamed protein product [Caenorhabditis auriculariae]
MASTIYRLRQFVIVCALFVSASFLWNGLKIGLEEDFATATEGRLQAEGSENSKPLKLIVTHSDNEGDGKTDNDSISNNSLEDSKCNIPHLDINGSEVIGFFEKHQPLKCQLSDSGIDPNWVFIDDEGKIRFIEKRKTAKCFIRYFRRFDDNRNEYDKPVNIFDGDVMTNSDFGVVACAQGTQKWKSLLWTVAENKEAHLKALKQKEMRENSKLIPNPEPRLNVYFLGFDSLSQMSFRRKLPKTVKFLEEVLGSVVLNGRF